MSILSNAVFLEISNRYKQRFSLTLKAVDEDGCVCSPGGPEPIDEVSEIVRTRRHGLQEGLRWGEPYAFFIAPGLISWIVRW